VKAGVRVGSSPGDHGRGGLQCRARLFPCYRNHVTAPSGPQPSPYKPPPPTPPRAFDVIVGGDDPESSRDAVLRRILLDLAEIKVTQRRMETDLHDLTWRRGG
jgi:hypothetical protein